MSCARLGLGMLQMPNTPGPSPADPAGQTTFSFPPSMIFPWETWRENDRWDRRVMKAASNVVKTGVWIILSYIYCIMILMALHKAGLSGNVGLEAVSGLWTHGRELILQGSMCWSLIRFQLLPYLHRAIINPQTSCWITCSCAGAVVHCDDFPILSGLWIFSTSSQRSER